MRDASSTLQTNVLIFFLFNAALTRLLSLHISTTRPCRMGLLASLLLVLCHTCQAIHLPHASNLTVHPRLRYVDYEPGRDMGIMAQMNFNGDTMPIHGIM